MPSRLIIFALLVPLSPVFAADPLDFKRDIQPIFQHSCGKCHMGDASLGKLRLDSPAAMLRGGVSGAAIVPGRSAQSILTKRLLGATDAPRMPLGAPPLTDEQMALIERWIDTADFSHTETSISQPAAIASTEASPLFGTKIRPILASRCYTCHGPSTQQNGLRLDSLAAIRKGSDSGAIVSPGHADDS